MHAQRLDTPPAERSSAEPPARAPQQTIARVVACAGDDCVVRASGSSYRARRARSCLVAPEAGDEVLTVRASERAFILAVLTREDAATTLAVAGDLRFSAPHGRISAVAREGLDLISGREVHVTGADIALTAKRCRVVGDEVQTVARSIETVAETISVNATRCLRRIEEFDQLRARAVDYAADGVMRLHSQTTLIKAKLLAKIDGAQIHLG